MRARFRGAAVAGGLVAVAVAGGRADAQTTSADTVVGLFRSLCLATGGERAAALAAADKAGWYPVPEGAMAASAPRFQNPVGRLHTDAGGFQFLILGEQTRVLGGRPTRLRACGVGGSVAQVARLDAAAQEIAGAPRSAHLSDGEQVVWAYSEEGGRRLALDDTDGRRTAAALESGALRLIARQTRVTPGMPTGLSVLVMDAPAR